MDEIKEAIKEHEGLLIFGILLALLLLHHGDLMGAIVLFLDKFSTIFEK